MSLITRCPACGTMFKVVTDQLKVSQGWVRCGQCAQVFDASLHLQPRELTPPPPIAPLPQEPQQSFAPQNNASQFWSQDNAAPAYVESPVQAWQPSVAPADQTAADPDDFDPAAWRRDMQAPPLNESGSLRLNPLGEAVEVAPQPSSERQDNMTGPDSPPSHPEQVDSSFRSGFNPDEDDEDERDEEAVAGMSEVPPDVSFVRDARRKAFWRRPLTRVALGFLSLLLVAALGVQVLVQQRDTLVLMEPQLKPVLVALCSQLKCEVGPLRRIEAIVIDSSTFNKIGNDAYRLSFSLKNTGTAVLAMPSLEVTLTDIQDQAVIRRVMAPAQLGAGPLLSPGTDFSGSVAMKVTPPDATGTANAGPLRVAGYRVLAFYP